MKINITLISTIATRRVNINNSSHACRNNREFEFLLTRSANLEMLVRVLISLIRKKKEYHESQTLYFHYNAS